MQPNFLSTFDRESRYPIFSTLCDCTSIAEIISLTQTCKKLSGLYQYLLPVQWDVDKALCRHVKDPLGFRSQMAKYNALIFGSFAMQYFKRVPWKDGSTLDMMVQEGPGPDLFSKYISEAEGYTKVNVKKYDRGIHITERNAKTKNGIKLIITSCLPAQSVLLGIGTTAGVNIISWNKAYSIFPLPTFIQHKCYLLKGWDGPREDGVSIHCESVWNVQGVMWPEEQRLNHSIRERRRVGDRYTWTIPFATRKVEWSKTPDYVLEHACFNMDLSIMNYYNEDFYDCEEEDIRYYTIEANSLESKVLKLTYLYGDVGMRDFLFPRLHSSTILELRKLDPARRPTNYDEILRNRGDVDNALGDFDRPLSWTYRDEEFPKWYKAFEKYRPEGKEDWLD